MRVSTTPAMMLVITSGKSIALNAAPCGSFGSAGTTSRTGEVAPDSWSAIWVSICATTGLAAEAVSTCGACPPMTMAPYARRPVIAWRAAAWLGT